MSNEKIVLEKPELSEAIQKDLDKLFLLAKNGKGEEDLLSVKGFGVNWIPLITHVPIEIHDGADFDDFIDTCTATLKSFIQTNIEGIYWVATGSKGFLLFHDDLGLVAYVNAVFNNSLITFHIWGHTGIIDYLESSKEEIFEGLSERNVLLRHFFIQHSHDTVVSRRGKLPVTPPNPNLTSIYPTFDVDAVVEDFLSSKSGVYFFLGAPGTGKSTLIKYMLSRAQDLSIATHGEDKTSFYLADADHVVEHNEFIDRVRECARGGVLVLEDVDKFLEPRKEGNSKMSALLSLTSGLIEEDLRIIITTNQPTVKHVDEALLRPGRTRKIVKFEPYTAKQVPPALDALELTRDLDYLKEGERYTLAEITSDVDNQTAAPKGIGFSS